MQRKRVEAGPALLCARRKSFRSAVSAAANDLMIEALERRELLSTAVVDTTYGSGGESLLTFNTHINSYSSSLFQTSAGKFVIGGYGGSGLNYSLLAGFTSSGAIDTTFGTNGQASSLSTFYNQPVYLINPSDGSTIVAYQGAADRYLANGTLDSTWITSNAGADSQTVQALAFRAGGKLIKAQSNGLVALNTNGSLDQTFASSGQLIFPTTSGAVSGTTQQFSPRAIVVQADGTIVVGGALQTTSAGTTTSQAEILRFTSTGSATASNAVQLLPLSTTASAIDSMTIDGNGLLVVAGQNGSSSFVERLTATALPDPTFGNSGIAQFDLQPNQTEEFNNVAADAQGRLILSDKPTSVFQQATAQIVRLTSAGAFDTSFNSTGIIDALPGLTAYQQSIAAFVPQSNGSIVVSFDFQATSDSRYSVGLMRLTAAGAIDSTFGASAGITQTYSIGPLQITPKASALQADGKLIVVGDDESLESDIYVARLNTDGSPDTSFGNTGEGVADIDLGSGSDRVDNVLIQSDGKILLFGGANPYPSPATGDIVRLNTDGSLDTTFGSNGIVRAPLSASNPELSAATIQSDGKIVIATDWNVAAVTLQRFNTNGTLDTTFGTAGTATFPSIPLSTAYGLAASSYITTLSNGEFLVGGLNSSKEPVVAKITSSGALDTTFGTGGVCTLNFTVSGSLLGIAVTSTGAIRVGTTQINTASPNAFVLSAITPSGTSDTSFGSNGSAVLPLAPLTGVNPPDPTDNITAFTQTASGEFLIVGNHKENDPFSTSSSGEFVTEMNSDGTLDTSFAPNRLNIFLTNASVIFVSGVQVNAQNQIYVIGINGNAETSGSIAAFRVIQGSAPLVTLNPTSQTLPVGQDAKFTAAATGTPTPTVQWMVQTVGSTGFGPLNGQTSPTLDLGAATVAESGNKYEAVFSNGVGTPATTTPATLTVNPGAATGSLTGSSSTATASYSLTTSGTSDWAHWGLGGVYGQFDHKTAGNSQISNITQLGTGASYGGYHDSSRSVSWTDGTPLATESADSGYIWANNAIGAGYSFTAPADTTSRTLYVYLGGYSSGGTLTATLSDSSAAPYNVSISGNAIYSDVVAITYSAASANQKLSISYTKSTNINGAGGSVDLIAAWLTTAAVTSAPVVTANPTSVTVIAGESVEFTAAASGIPTPTLQWLYKTPGSSSFTAITNPSTTVRSLQVDNVLLSQNGTQYEAMFTNGVGSPVLTAPATLTVVSPTTGITGLASTNGGIYNLTYDGPSDWAHWGTGGAYGAFDHKAAGNSQISNVTTLGNGNYGAYQDPSRDVLWSDGTPLATDPGDNGYIWANNAIGAGYSFTVPADTTPRTIDVYVGGYSTGSTLTATLSDNSAAPYSLTFSGSGIFSYTDAITYAATSANQKLTITYTKSSNINGAGGSADLIAAWLAGPAAATSAPVVTTNPVTQSVNVGQTVSFTAAASGNPTPTVQWMVKTVGASSFVALNGQTSTTLNLSAATAIESGNQYEAVFSNGVGAAATTSAATLTVNAATATGVLTGSSIAPASSYNLTTAGGTDWAHWGLNGGYGNFDHKSSGNSQISNVTQLGSGSYGGYYDSSRSVSWTDGTPQTSDTGDNGYIWANNAIGAGYSFTAPADTTTRTLYVYLGGYSTGTTLTATLSDGSATPYTVSFSGNALFNNLVTITYKAASANQKITLNYIKTSNINGAGGSADLIAAWLA